MTQTFATNSNNDIYINSSGLLQIDTGINAVEDACATATKMQLGEAVLQTTLGIPNFQNVWNGVPNLAIWENYLRSTIASVNGVNNIVSLSIKKQQNTLSYVATIETIYGTAYLNG